MGNKINIAELLKDCPSGMELDCTMYENVYFDKTYNEEDCLYPIGCYIIVDNNRNSVNFTKYGEFNYHSNAKCIIFPKGKTTWEGFAPPCKFRDGDILVHTQNERLLISIYHKIISEFIIKTHCVLWDNVEGLSINNEICCYDDYVRLATDEEKQKLFKAIEDNGYKWNAETKTLEKLIETEFKVGDRIRHKTNTRQENVVTEIKDTHYILDDESALPFIFQDQYVIVPNKFDITTLKPFDKVLMRSSNAREWTVTLYSHYNNNKFYGCGMCCDQCIPYEHNEHLRGTTNDCDDFYKTW